jgi:small-conductance mechanosensitive channel
MDKIRKMSLNYMRQGLYFSTALFLLTLLVMQVWFLDLLAPAIVSVAFTLLVCFTIGLVWRYVAKNSPDSLPTFFTAVSGFRLLLALAVMFVYYLLNKETMLNFFLVFMVFYVASLAHHTIFFARVSNK